MDNRRIMLTQIASSVFVMLVAVVMVVINHRKHKRRYTMYQSIEFREQNRRQHIFRILRGGKNNCRAYIRMNVPTFFTLAKLIREMNLLRDSRHVIVEEQLMTFLRTCGHNKKNKVLKIGFIRSGSTVNRYFNKVLEAICGIRHLYMKQAKRRTDPFIATNLDFSAYFKDCIGMIDGTHASATVPSDKVANFRGRKGLHKMYLPQ